jgi:hypothetical protein
MLKYVVRAGGAFEYPAFALQAALYIAAVGEHTVPDRMSRSYITNRSSFSGGHPVPHTPFGDAINLLLHRAGIGVDVEGDHPI